MLAKKTIKIVSNKKPVSTMITPLVLQQFSMRLIQRDINAPVLSFQERFNPSSTLGLSVLHILDVQCSLPMVANGMKSVVKTRASSQWSPLPGGWPIAGQCPERLSWRLCQQSADTPIVGKMQQPSSLQPSAKT